MAGSAAWQAEFEQRFTPAGFTTPTVEAGRLALAPPDGLRFDYRTGVGRVFAVEEGIARMVDQGAGSCEAFRLDPATWGRLPLAALLDPAAAEASFTVAATARGVRLAPREPLPEVAEIVLEPGADGLPASILVVDASGNRNEFVFTSWRRTAVPGDAFFRPSLPGQAPCSPEQE
ncbi:MAG: outer membrane lipoprotein carrier protein LolA [Acidobacteriota bacterium]